MAKAPATKKAPHTLAQPAPLRRMIDPDPTNTALGELMSASLSFMSAWLPQYPFKYTSWPASAHITLSIDQSMLVPDDPDEPGEAMAVTQWDMVRSLLAQGGEITSLGYQLKRSDEVPRVQFTVGLGVVSNEWDTKTALDVTLHPPLDLRPIWDRANNKSDDIAGEIMNWIYEALERSTGSSASWEQLLDILTDPDPVAVD